MFNQSLTAKRIFLNACLLIMAAAIFSGGMRVAAQDSDYACERRRAFSLLDESKMI